MKLFDPLLEPITHFRGPYDFLSNFYECTVPYDQIVFKSAEHAYAAAKTRDQRMRIKIAQLSTPSVAKKIGRQLELPKNWDRHRRPIMRKIVLNKFVYNLKLRKKLLDTGMRQLIEGNHWGDTFWGVCGGVGDNHLGVILMETRRYVEVME